MPEVEMDYWTLVLILGAVVIVAVVVLLSMLVYFVKIIDKRVAEVLSTLAAVSANTSKAALIPATADSVDAVLAEGLQHHLFLGRVVASSREGES